jgi:hypothetical protein
VCLEEERLTPFVPSNLPDAQAFLSQYHTLVNPVQSEHTWPALSDPLVISNLVKFSPAVLGVSILTNHSGLVLAYLFEHVKKQEQLDSDVDLAIETFKKIEKYGDDEKYTKETNEQTKKKR